MSEIIFQKKRRFRIDPTNPYRTRFMIFSVVQERGYRIKAEQTDYVLRSQVAQEAVDTPIVGSVSIAKQLVEHMLDTVRDVADVPDVYKKWREGRLALINENKNLLVKEAIRKRFARNLKKM